MRAAVCVCAALISTVFFAVLVSGKYAKYEVTAADTKNKDTLSWALKNMMPPSLFNSHHPAHDPRFPHVETDYFQNPFWMPHARVLRTNAPPAITEANDQDKHIEGAGIDPPPHAMQSYVDFLRKHQSATHNLARLDKADWLDATSDAERKVIERRNSWDRDGFWQRVAGIDPHRRPLATQYAQSRSKPLEMHGEDPVVSLADSKSSWLLFMFAEWCPAAKSAAPHMFEAFRRVRAATLLGNAPSVASPQTSIPGGLKGSQLMEIAKRNVYGEKEFSEKLSNYGLQLGVVNITQDPLVAKAFDITPFGKGLSIPQMYVKRGDLGKVYRYIAPNNWGADELTKWALGGYLKNGKDTEVMSLPTFPASSKKTEEVVDEGAIPGMQEIVDAFPEAYRVMRNFLRQNAAASVVGSFVYGVLLAAFFSRWT